MKPSGINNRLQLNGFTGPLLIVFIVSVVIFSPFITIWSLNTLFPVLAIPYDFETWLAVIILGTFLSFNIRAR